MTIQPHLNLLSALAPATAAPTAAVASNATQNVRFDAALLQAAKVVRDGSDSQGLGQALTPKVEEALKSLFSQLAQKPADQLQQLAKQPDLLKPTVDAIAQAQGLDTQETAELKSLAPMATENLVQALNGTKLAPVDTANLAQPGTISGPQGREPGTPVDPATSFKPAPVAALSTEAPPVTTATVSTPKTTALDSSALAQSAASVTPVTHKQDASTALQTSLAQAMVWAGTLVSSRTDDGSRSDSTLSLAARSAQSAAPVAEVAAIKVSTLQSLQLPQDAAKKADVGPAASTQATVRPPAPVRTVVINGVPVKTQPSAGSTLSEDSDASAAPASVSLQAVAVQRSLSPEIQAPASESQAPSTAPVRDQAAPVASTPKSATEQSLDFKIAALPSDAPATPIQDGSLFVLKGDGSTQGTPQVQAPQEPATAVQVQPLAQPLQAAASPAPGQPAAVQAAALPTPAAPQAPVSSVLPIAPAFTPSAPVLTQAPATAPVAPQQAPAPAAAAVVVAQAPAAATASVPVMAALPVPQAVQATPQQPSGASPKAEAASAAAENAPHLAPEPQVQENSVGFQALKHSSPEEAGQPGFSFGQDTLRSLVSQVSRQAGVRDAAFTQVTDALVDSAVKETSRLIINLKPANLGQVQVDLSVEGGKVTARLIASTPEVRDAFVRDLPAFKASLEAQGLRIDQVAVAVRGEGNLNAQSQNQGQARNPWANAVPMPQNGAPAVGVVASNAWAQAPGSDTLFSALA